MLVFIDDIKNRAFQTAQNGLSLWRRRHLRFRDLRATPMWRTVLTTTRQHVFSSSSSGVGQRYSAERPQKVHLARNIFHLIHRWANRSGIPASSREIECFSVNSMHRRRTEAPPPPISTSRARAAFPAISLGFPL